MLLLSPVCVLGGKRKERELKGAPTPTGYLHSEK